MSDDHDTGLLNGWMTDSGLTADDAAVHLDVSPRTMSRMRSGGSVKAEYIRKIAIWYWQHWRKK